jgi:hypothetical protein
MAANDAPESSSNGVPKSIFLLHTKQISGLALSFAQTLYEWVATRQTNGKRLKL